jgi:sporulation protein YlmC with PRC-barrel domain
MDIPINAYVRCADVLFGRSTCLIINPRTEQVTHLVVEETQFPHSQRLVPIDQVVEATPHLIQLRCTSRQLERMESFVETEFVESPIPDYMSGSSMAWPYVMPEPMLMPIEHEQIPPGELPIRRGARVEATDGHVGRVDEFLVDPANGYITHLVLREGHLWSPREVTIPVSQIDRIEEDTVYLKLDRHSIGALPAIPIRRMEPPIRLL